MKRERSWFVRNMWTRVVYGKLKVPMDTDTDEVLELARKKFWIKCHARNIEIFNHNIPFVPPVSYRDELMKLGY